MISVRDGASADILLPPISIAGQQHDLHRVCIIGLALAVFVAKLAIAYNTIGTNDAVFFYGFAKVLHQHSLEWTYAHSRYFNHPPLTAYFLRGIYWLTEQSWSQNLGIHFPFLLRLPGIIADFVVVLIILRISTTELQIPIWAVALFALSPVSIMVSGFHGNTDPVMVLFLVCAVFMCMRGQPVFCGLFFALSCQIKIIPLLLLPVFLCFWFPRRRLFHFVSIFATLSAIGWAEPLLHFPFLFFRNVFAYGSYWGVWGITYFLRLTQLKSFDGTGAFGLPFAPQAIATLLKIFIVATVCLIAWRRRNVPEKEIGVSIACSWLVFFVFSPGVCVQYMVWLAPFVLVLSPMLYVWLLGASSIFLFVFYNVTAGGLPWSVALSTDQAIATWAPFSLLPWLVLLGGLILWIRGNRGKSETNSLIVDDVSAGKTSAVPC